VNILSDLIIFKLFCICIFNQNIWQKCFNVLRVITWT